jgi:pyridoxal phosphate enzyme (YggS family)
MSAADDNTDDTLPARIARVQARLAAACQRAGRDPSSVTLLAVSKTFPADTVRQAHQAGLHRFGESYAQELRDKARELAALPLEWHFVGRLQRNKLKYVVGTAALIHAVDSTALAGAIAERAQAAGRVQPVLLEVNLGGEASKGGVTEAELPALIAACGKLPALELQGLMTLPPHTDDPEGARPHFRRLAELARAHGLGVLSMGMSHDAEVAIDCGATIVRIGTALFGERSAAVPPPTSA